MLTFGFPSEGGLAEPPPVHGVAVMLGIILQGLPVELCATPALDRSQASQSLCLKSC